MTVEIISGTVPERDELAALYGAVGWVTARSDGRLVGVTRVISDTVTIAYVQDIPVSPEEQRGGVGRRLVTEALAPYATVRQKVLLTDDEPGQRAFVKFD